jgi:hypothetical protein
MISRTKAPCSQIAHDVRAVAGGQKIPTTADVQKTLQRLTDDRRNLTSRWVSFPSSLDGIVVSLASLVSGGN